MILDLDNVQTLLISTLENFKLFANTNNLKTDIVNSYNHPFVRDYSKLQCSNVLVIKFNEFDDIMSPKCRVGSFYKNFNEFYLHFEAFFISFQSQINTKQTHANMLKLYTLFAQFITERGQTLATTKQKDKDYNIEVDFTIFSISNMLYSGQLNLQSPNSHIAYVCSENFKARTRIWEYKISKYLRR